MQKTLNLTLALLSLTIPIVLSCTNSQLDKYTQNLDQPNNCVAIPEAIYKFINYNRDSIYERVESLVLKDDPTISKDRLLNLKKEVKKYVFPETPNSLILDWNIYDVDFCTELESTYVYGPEDSIQSKVHICKPIWNENVVFDEFAQIRWEQKAIVLYYCFELKEKLGQVTSYTAIKKGEMDEVFILAPPKFKFLGEINIHVSFAGLKIVIPSKPVILYSNLPDPVEIWR